jgi:hypothetical protein
MSPRTLACMAVLHRIEALAGNGRYAVTFQRADRSEQTAVVQLSGSSVTAAEASLPEGWTTSSEPFAALADVVLALERARSLGPAASSLMDVDGGWDVMMGNVVLGESGRPTCTAHGPMEPGSGDVWTCAECGARAAYSG